MCVCVSRRRRTKGSRRTRYTILDNMDEQERVELKPQFSKSVLRWTAEWSSDALPGSDFMASSRLSSGVKHRTTEHNSSLMLSESELDSDQDVVFSRDGPAHSRNRPNGPGPT